MKSSAMTWRWGNDEFSVSADKRIAPADGPYNLYVFHDPGFRPKDDAAFLMGAGGNLERMAPK